MILLEDAKTKTESLKQFEVGCFYLVHVSIWTDKRIPALCVKKGKYRIHFEYLSREMDGSLRKFVCWRSLGHTARGDEIASSNERFSTFMSVYPDDLADKPKMWDEIPSDFQKRQRKAQAAERENLHKARSILRTTRQEEQNDDASKAIYKTSGQH